MSALFFFSVFWLYNYNSLLVTSQSPLRCWWWIQNKHALVAFNALRNTQLCQRLATRRMRTFVTSLSLMHVLERWVAVAVRAYWVALKSKYGLIEIHDYYLWCDQAKSVWSRSNSVFISVTKCMHHFDSYILLKTPMKLVNWFQRYELLKDATNNRKQNTFSVLFGSILKSIFPTFDWFCLITSHLLS